MQRRLCGSVRSAALVRGHWWRVALFTVVVAGLGLLLGPVVGGLLLLATSAAFNVINLITALVYTVTMPFVAIATTYLYYVWGAQSRFTRRGCIRG